MVKNPRPSTWHAAILVQYMEIEAGPNKSINGGNTGRFDNWASRPAPGRRKEETRRQ